MEIFNMIYEARNRTKRQYKVYMREATANLLSSVGALAGLTRSEVVDALANSFLRKIGKTVLYLTSDDTLKIEKLKEAIRDKK